MERGATANCVFSFPESVDFDEIEAIQLYVRGVRSNIEKVKEHGDMTLLDENKIAVCFSQKDTLSFKDNENVRIQWHWREKNGTARVSKIIKTNIYEFLGSGPI